MSIPEIKENNNTYNYTISCGPLQYKKQTTLTRGMANLDTMLSCLETKRPQIEENTWQILAKLNHVKNKASLTMTKLWNLLFGTGEWYNEDYARKTIKNFIKCPEEQKTPEMRQALLQIYDHLEACSENGKNYTKGIHREELLEKKVEDEIQNEVEENLLEDILSLIYDALPEAETVKKVAATFLNTGGKMAGKAALEAIGTFFAGPAGAKVVPLVGMKLAKIANIVIKEVAKHYQIDVATTTKDKKTSVEEQKQPPRPITCRDIVVYKPQIAVL